MHVYHCFKTNVNLPLKIFLTGSAGTGKSMVIKVLYHLLTHHFNKEEPGEVDLDSEVVLLTASTGIAAHLIGGNTLHSAFKIMPTIVNISSNVTNTIRMKLKRVKLIIADEASLIGAKFLSQINQRLKILTGQNTDFGGISIIFVGDLMQLPPVKDRHIFAVPNVGELSGLIQTSALWSQVEIFQLIQVMRQKDDLAFVNALNNMAHNCMTEEDVKLLESRVIKREDIDKKVPLDCRRLFATNKEVDDYNEKRIKAISGFSYASVAEDSIYSKSLSEKEKKIISKVSSQSRKMRHKV